MSQKKFGADWKTEKILWALTELDNPTTTSEIREATGLENTDIINYRLRKKLEPHGIVELQQPLADDGRSLPKEVSLTEDGEAIAEEVADRQGDQMSVDGTLTALSDSVDQLNSRITQLEQRLEGTNSSEVSDEIESIQEKQESLQEQVSNLAMRYNEIDKSQYGGFSEDTVEQIETMRVAIRALREFVVEDLEREQELKAQVQSAAEDIKGENPN